MRRFFPFPLEAGGKTDGKNPRPVQTLAHEGSCVLLFSLAYLLLLVVLVPSVTGPTALAAVFCVCYVLLWWKQP